MDTVKYKDALLDGLENAKRMQYTWLALSVDEATAKKQELVHQWLGHPRRQRFNKCLELMDLSEL